MTQTDIFKDRRAERLLRAFAAVAAVLALTAVVGISVSADADTQVGTLNTSPEDPKVIYGLHNFDNKYVIEINSNSFLISSKVESNPNLLVITVDRDVVADGSGVFKIHLKVNSRNHDNLPEHFDFALRFTDESSQYVIMYLRMVLINPDFDIGTSKTYDVIDNNGSWIDLNMKGMPVVSQMPTGSTATYKLDCGSGFKPAEVKDGLVKLPSNLGTGAKTCKMQVSLTIPNAYEQTFTSKEFTVNVQAKPTFTLPSDSYDKFAGETLTVSLDLTGTDVPGKWIVTKPKAAGDVEIDYTAAAVNLSLSSLTADNEGEYSVKFVATGGAVSESRKFTLNVYTIVESGVITVTGLGEGGIMQVGENTLKSNVKVEEVITCSMTVKDSSGEDVKNQFDFDTEGYLLVKSKIQEGEYTLRFTTESSHKITDLTVNLKYIEPPTIAGITPVSSFTVG